MTIPGNRPPNIFVRKGKGVYIVKNTGTQQRKAPQNGSSRAQRDHEEELSNLDPIGDLQTYVRQYVKEQPEISMLTCLGIGFILGWKLKPW